MEEELLHYVWRHKLYPLQGLFTTKGQRVEVIDPGLPNRNAGPDFFNAKLKLNQVLWVGNVEVHVSASQWFEHGHHLDARYDNVVLHVVAEADAEVTRLNGEPIATLVLPCPEEIGLRYAELRQADYYPPCYEIIPSLSRLTV